MTRGVKWAIGIAVVVAIIVALYFAFRGGPSALAGVIGRPDAVFTPDRAGRYPGEPGWEDAGA